MLGLAEFEALQYLQGQGVNTVRVRLAEKPEAAAEFAAEAGYPVVLKANVPEVFHKSEIGGVRTGITDVRMLNEAWEGIADAVQAVGHQCQGMLVQPMVRGFEMIVGASYEEQFGPVVMVGAGGIYTELFRDVAFRLAPVTLAEAGRMVDELRTAAILAGARGQGPLCRSGLEEIIVRVSDIIATGNFAEIDLNPVIVTKDRAVAVDAVLVNRNV